MSYQDLVLGFNKGFDRSITPFKADLDTAYEMLNLRIARAERGRLEQTPYFGSADYVAGSYWNNSSSVTEISTSPVFGSWYNQQSGQSSLFSLFTMRTNGTQVPIFYQTMLMTATEDVTKGCLLDINNIIGFGINLGSTFEVVVDGAATFKWRKNASGGYTTGVPITTTGVSIDGGNATIWFLASAGFTITDGWTWTRTDCTTSPVNAAIVSPTGSISYFQTSEYGNGLFWITHDARVMFYDPVVGYARSVGYQPICGYHLKIFYDHLFVTDSNINVTADVRNGQLRNSDLNDLDDFISTDLNEADLHTFHSLAEGEAGYGGITIQQLFIVANRLYLLDGKMVRATPYLGLPFVFSFEDVQVFGMPITGTSTRSLIQTHNGAYLFLKDGVWFTDGVTFTHVGAAQGLTNLGNTTTGAMDFVNNELVVLDTVSKIVWVYQELYKSWHRRACSFATAPRAIFYFGSSAILAIGTNSLHYMLEDTAAASTPIKDSTSGASFTLPTVTSQLVGYGNFAQVKDVSGSHLLARAATVSGISIGYQQTSNIIIKLYWGSSTDGTVIVATTDITSVWTLATADTELSYPRFASRAPAFRLDVTTADITKPPAGVSIIQFQPHITIPAPVPTR